MATQADGTVYINSSIDTDGFTAGGKEIEAAARRAAKTVKGIGDAARIALERQTAAFVKSNQLYAQQEQKVQDLQNKLEEMAGQTVETTAFKEIQKQIDTDTAKLNRLIQTQEEFLQTGGKTTSTAYQRRLMQIDELRNSIEYAKAEQDELLQSGQAYQPVDTSAVTDKLIAEQQRLQQMGEALNVSYDSLKSKLEQYGGSIAGAAQKHGLLRKALSSVAGAAKRAGAAMLLFHKNTKKSNGSIGTGIKNMLKYTLGISSLLMLLKKIKSAVKDGMQNLAQYSGETNTHLSALKSSMTQLKNSLATAFNPILTVIEPILTRFINLLSQAATYVGMFFASLTGKTTFTKAVAVWEDYANSIGAAADNAKKALKYLSGLDEIRTYPGYDDSSVGVSPADMFEEVPIDNRILDWLEKIKNFLKPILDYLNKLKDIFMQGFWDGLGDWEYRWESIKNSLASIKDSLIDIWTDPKVLAAADRWAQSVAYMLGSLVGSLASIGLTIATNIVGGIAKYLEQNKERIKQHLISMFDIWTEINYMFADLFQSIAYVFEAFAGEQGQQLTANVIGIFWDAFMSIEELASKIFRDVAQIIIQPFVDNKEAFRTALEGFLGVLMEVTGTIKQGIDNTFDKLNEVYEAHFKPFFDFVAQGLSDLVDQFLEFWNGSVQPILDEWETDFDELWKNHIQPLLSNLAELLGKVADLLKVLWENILKPFISWYIENILPKVLPVIKAIWSMVSDFVGYMYDAINSLITILGGIIDFLTGVFSGDWKLAFKGLYDIVNGFANLVTSLISSFLSILGNLLNVFIASIKSGISSFVQIVQKTIQNSLNYIKSNIVGKFNEIISAFLNFKSNISNMWTQIWQGLYNKVMEFVNKIKSAVSSVFDWISNKINSMSRSIGSIGNMVSSAFKGINISIPNANIPVVSVPQIATANIPYLASGAVIPPNAPFAAILGDQKNGKNLEMPENLLRKIVREESGSNKGFNGTIRIPLSINGRQVLEAIITEAQLQQMMNGRNPFEMA